MTNPTYKDLKTAKMFMKSPALAVTNVPVISKNRPLRQRLTTVILKFYLRLRHNTMTLGSLNRLLAWTTTAQEMSITGLELCRPINLNNYES
ncbi:uncharacterized protein PGTG_06237 [Puccinia graminis f. sp. tritici CRL 75-36-700-3]|uniref:Uncharacterized protein n=1 Tax=Puccinia graminis f. sp. tritici (strain CRL 75-36-700-3 / race SCCL) TaxID=418459 RepID=E3K7F7_PUCGT|nr:uncharacterized protein PGTG_06237 [Puccinia graminis f. sp. tritici CRL 75-36-700-3]EFP80281.2 hypothetical protein PGTG_06237 [Puccinia graminis f. sp. tritici CRL 75-36-700-3]